MASKKRHPRKGTHSFLVWGPIWNLNIEIHEWTSAMNAGQALKQVQNKLEERYHHRLAVYLGDCTVTRGRRRTKSDSAR